MTITLKRCIAPLTLLAAGFFGLQFNNEAEENRELRAQQATLETEVQQKDQRIQILESDSQRKDWQIQSYELALADYQGHLLAAYHPPVEPGVDYGTVAGDSLKAAGLCLLTKSPLLVTAGPVAWLTPCAIAGGTKAATGAAGL